jgi:hypothetical protein
MYKHCNSTISQQGQPEAVDGDLAFTILVKREGLDDETALQHETTGVVQEAVNDAVRGAVHGAVQEVRQCKTVQK